MSYANAYNELRGRFNTLWGSTTPIAWPNAAFTTPLVPWVRFTVRSGEANQLTFGASTNNFRHSGVIIIQVFTLLDTGEALALQHADQIASIFRNWCGQSVRCRTPSVKDIGNDGEGWYQVNVVVPFQWDELL